MRIQVMDRTSRGMGYILVADVFKEDLDSLPKEAGALKLRVLNRGRGTLGHEAGSPEARKAVDLLVRLCGGEALWPEQIQALNPALD